MIELAAVGMGIALVWLWIDSMAAREGAVLTGRRACTEQGLQFLDETVVIVGVGLERDGEGQLRLRRRYGFEFSDTGDNRRQGWVVMLGKRVKSVELEPHRFTGL